MRPVVTTKSTLVSGPFYGVLQCWMSSDRTQTFHSLWLCSLNLLQEPFWKKKSSSSQPVRQKGRYIRTKRWFCKTIEGAGFHEWNGVLWIDLILLLIVCIDKHFNYFTPAHSLYLALNVAKLLSLYFQLSSHTKYSECLFYWNVEEPSDIHPQV